MTRKRSRLAKECGSSASCHLGMKRLLEELNWNTTLIYLDDVIVFGKAFLQEEKLLASVRRT